ncbi:uridine diphosphate glucose pyrophosphatase NUDT14-like [Daktulosphaira vitifoliae]|uniref:uridine diphosphate glucose pyrophosphatase NUDT14-like n=1 Tax=Daktulosphaira vitifoliae TaxID=58002 RepID=UPI0021A9A436|nr:uridine diphosphate glucose pyrophosphatase NUDT14-like [Daktulosphaira vitifoliae]XP_050546566.1 uridine diphosphate glucose pyrophosphatase NUDT14-like [Daktulosphaira vitifoliae]XP_050546567.1 uridine diphosphate glucose pyrophosphatase NUDT14-like [Daktulosphaira vitifoliae]XP_050546568.1 uridine diphosphate glucose pyrophosphatase NUDT14-like [Daktulosphaira vitifoliae]
MKPISQMIAVKTTESIFIKPFSLLFKQGEKEIKWDLMESHDAVFVIIYNRTRNTLVCVKQFRPAVYYKSIPEFDRPKEGPIDTVKYPPSSGLTVEFCAGIVDKNKSLEEIAVDEVKEECGYAVKTSDLQKIISCKSGLSITGTNQTFFYTEVTDHMKVSEGGGLASEGEDIEVVEYTIPQIKDFVTQSEVLNSSTSFLFGLMWFLANKIVLNT